MLPVLIPSKLTPLRPCGLTPASPTDGGPLLIRSRISTAWKSTLDLDWLRSS